MKRQLSSVTPFPNSKSEWSSLRFLPDEPIKKFPNNRSSINRYDEPKDIYQALD